MKKLIVPLVAGLGLFVALPFGSAQTAETWQMPPKMPDIDIGVPPKKLQESNTIEAQGKLTKGPSNIWHHGPAWHITVGQQRYELDLGANKWLYRLAAELEGKTVRVVGRYQHRVDMPAVPLGSNGERIAIRVIPSHYEAIVVEDLEKVAGNQPGFVRIEIRGTLHWKSDVGFPPEKLTIVTAQGERFVLDLSRNPDLRHLARRLNGQPIVLQGTVERWHPVREICGTHFQLQALALPIVTVHRLWPADGRTIELRKIDVQGRLLPASRDLKQPSLVVLVNGQSYPLDFAGNQQLRERAVKLTGKTVRIKGVIETRDFCANPVVDQTSAGLGLVVLEQGNVLVVDSIEEVQVQWIKEIKQVQVRGKLQWHGNAKGKLPGGQTIMTTKGYAWEGYYVEVDGRRYRLEVSCKMAGYLDHFVGQTVVVDGRLVTRFAFDLPPNPMPRMYDAIVVTDLWQVK
jgi:hypothetical protein